MTYDTTYNVENSVLILPIFPCSNQIFLNTCNNSVLYVNVNTALTNGTSDMNVNKPEYQ